MLVLWAASRTSRMPSLWLDVLWSTLNIPSWLGMMVSSLSLSLSQSLSESLSLLLLVLCTMLCIIHTATTFATQMGFPKEDLHTDYSWYVQQSW